MYVTVLRMEGIRRKCLVVNVADAVELPPGGCCMFDADSTYPIAPSGGCAAAGVLQMVCSVC